MPAPDPIAAWNHLVAAREARRAATLHPLPLNDRWADRAADYDLRVRSHQFRDETIWRFLQTLLPSPHANASLLDIGAGTGRWALPFAAILHHVTAIEPSPSMRHLLQANTTRARLRNITILSSPWPDTPVPPHDLVLCAHAMYGARDIARWIHAMHAAARSTCILYIRDPTPEDPISIVAQAAFGTPHAVPDLPMALAVLQTLGITPAIRREDPAAHPPRIHPSRAAAEAWAIQRLHLPPPHLPLLQRVLDSSLRTLPNGAVQWPNTTPAALLYWPPPP